MNNIENVNNYETGAEFWHGTLASHGVDKATEICMQYLNAQLQTELSKADEQFSRDLFKTMYEATARDARLQKIIYPYSYEEAYKNTEGSYYHASRKLNRECVLAIDTAIRESCYKVNYYNLETAAWVMILKYGFERVNAILAYHTKKHEYDGRYSRTNKEWAQGIGILEKTFDGTYLNSHAMLVDGFTDHIRRIYLDLGAQQFALPGQEEHGEFVHGYEVIRSITFDNKGGFAIGYNPNAADLYVCWHFKSEDNSRDFYWGRYGGQQTATDSYLARIFVHLSDGSIG